MVAYALPHDHPIMEYTADEWRQMAARKSLKSFTGRMFPGYETANHIRHLITELEWAVNTEGARLLVTMPPRHSKSLHVSENLPAWYLGRNPDKRIIAASHTASLAFTFSRRVRNKIASERYPFPGVAIAGDKGAVQAWDIAGHLGGYYAVGVGGSPTGSGGDLIVIDDPIRSAADADSETVRDALWEWYTGTIRTRLEPGGSIILTATRWHDDDLTGRLLAAQTTGGEQWRHVHMPALNDAGDALWPERWSAESLRAIKGTVGGRVWSSQYQGDPIPAEGGMFKRHWWQPYRTLPELKRVELLMDSAFKEGVENDYSVIACWGTDGNGSAYLIRVWRDRVAFPELLKMAHKAHDWARAEFPHIRVPLVIEDKASGQSALQTLKRPLPQMDGSVLPALPVIAFPVKSTENKVARAEGVTPIVEGGRAFIPAQRNGWDLDAWIQEHERFPLGTHDDQVDTTSMALSRMTARSNTVRGIR
jgi:predicted phage terminase large subunit-like protein